MSSVPLNQFRYCLGQYNLSKTLQSVEDDGCSRPQPTSQCMPVWGGGRGGGRICLEGGSSPGRGRATRNECKGAENDLLATGAHQGVPSPYSLDQANVFLRAYGHHVKLSEVHAQGLIHNYSRVVPGHHVPGSTCAQQSDCTDSAMQ